MSIPDVHVAMANAGRLDAQQYLLTPGLGIRVLPRFQWLSPFDDLHRMHPGASIPRNPMIQASPRLFSHHRTFTSRSIHVGVARPMALHRVLAMSIRGAHGGAQSMLRSAVVG